MPAVNENFGNPPDLTTTNATPTDMTSVPINDGETVYGTITVMARAADGTSSVWEVRGVVKRVGGGNLALVGSTTTVARINDAGAASWIMALALSGNNIIVRVTGAAGVTIDWFLMVNLTGMK